MRKTDKSTATRRLIVPTPMVFDCELRSPKREPARELILLLHGFEETGARLLSKLKSILPDDAVIVAPNALFPIPRRAETGYKLGYSWYIYDPVTGEYIIDMSPALEFLRNAVAQLGYAELPKRVIGFSQGGYLAPFAAQSLGKTTQVIGLACEYLGDELEGPTAFRIDGVHGEKDEVVPAAEARATHAALGTRANGGELIVLEASGHRIDDEMRDAVSLLLTK